MEQVRSTLTDARRAARRYAAALVMRAVAEARRARLLPYSGRVHATDVAATQGQATVLLAGGQAAEVSLWTFADAGVLPDEGIVVLRDRIVLESAKKPWAFDRQGVLPLRRLPSSLLAARRVATITVPALRRSWGHWLLDSMPRLYLLDQVFGIRDVDVVVGASVRGSYLDAITAYLPADYRLVRAAADTLGHAAEVLLPAYLPVAQTGTLPPAALAWLARIAPATAPTRRLYIARPPGIDRQMRNEAEIRAALEAHGFETVYPERLSFVEQVAMFASAQTIVGTHGSGLTGAIYMAPGGSVIELFPSPASLPAACPRYNQRLAGSVGLAYTSIHGAARHERDSFTIRTKELEAALER